MLTEDEQKQLDAEKAEQEAKHQSVLDHARENLDALRDEDDPTPDEPEPTLEPDDEPEDDPQPEEDEPEPEPESDDEPAGDKPEDEPAGDEHALTQAEIRAAIHSGWTQDDIEELAQANPGLAKKTCAKALESQNNLSKKFSELGKARATTPESPAEPKPEPKPKASKIDFTALEKEYENDPIVGVLKQVVEQNQSLSDEVNSLRETNAKGEDKVSKAQAAQDAAIVQQIDSFFERPDVAAYKETYGEVEKGSRDWDNLTQGQIKKRYEVAEQANLIMLGAQQQGVDMSLDEAFERAHFLVTKDVQEATIRKSIKAKAVKRSKAITLEPSATKKVADSNVKTKEKAEQNAGRRLRKLFGR